MKLLIPWRGFTPFVPIRRLAGGQAAGRAEITARVTQRDTAMEHNAVRNTEHFVHPFHDLRMQGRQYAADTERTRREQQVLYAGEG